MKEENVSDPEIKLILAEKFIHSAIQKLNNLLSCCQEVNMTQHMCSNVAANVEHQLQIKLGYTNNEYIIKKSKKRKSKL